MNQYVTGNTLQVVKGHCVQALDSPLLRFSKDCGTLIKLLREKQKMTQVQLAERLCVSDKTISKWETGRGFPDISFLEPLAKILKVSVLELLSGNEIINKNKSGNLNRSRFYNCPICGNVIFSVGEALISCCGIQLPPIEVENALGAENSESIENLGENDLFQNHKINVQNVEDEFFVNVNHPMEKEHYICWLAVVRLNSVEIIKLYPEQNAEARIKFGRRIKIFAYCNRHGLFEVKI